MILVDANILLYAYNSSSEFHGKAKKWFEREVSRGTLIRFSWITIHAFMRIVTNIHAYPNPYQPEEAARIVSNWFSRQNIDVLDPGDRYWNIFSGILGSSQIRGPLVMDAHLAALAMEHGAGICTHDEDFSRFEDIRIIDPCKQGSAQK